MRRLAAIGSIALVLAGCGGGEEPTSAPPDTGFDASRAFEDLRAQVEIGPRPAGSEAAHETAGFIAGQMREAGLDGVTVQGPRKNVLGTIPGDLPGTVVVGAHFDTKDDIPGFVGANDGASGVAVLLELARSLPARLSGPSVQLVAFDAEEARGDRDFDLDGARGSRQYVAYAREGRQGSPPLTQIKAMVLFDMIGDCDLQIPYEPNSDQDLYALFAVTRAELNNGDAEPFEFNTFPVGDDHEPFLEAGIPAAVFIDFTYGPGAPPGRYWHTRKDTIDKVCESSLGTVGETALRAIPKIR